MHVEEKERGKKKTPIIRSAGAADFLSLRGHSLFFSNAIRIFTLLYLLPSIKFIRILLPAAAITVHFTPRLDRLLIPPLFCLKSSPGALQTVAGTQIYCLPPPPPYRACFSVPGPCVSIPAFVPRLADSLAHRQNTICPLGLVRHRRDVVCWFVYAGEEALRGEREKCVEREGKSGHGLRDMSVCQRRNEKLRKPADPDLMPEVDGAGLFRG